jgi:nucleotide-binding universal stress UspA family protein
MITMAKRILVPVDTREDSEAIVPVVAAMAERSGGSVRLIRVSPLPERVVGPYGRTIAYSDQEMTRLTAEGLDDLQHIESELHGIPVDSVVRFGDPVAEILLEAEAFDADLIALTAARRGRLGRALSPGLADRLIPRAPVPTLVLHGRERVA